MGSVFKVIGILGTGLMLSSSMAMAQFANLNVGAQQDTVQMAALPVGGNIAAAQAAPAPTPIPMVVNQMQIAPMLLQVAPPAPVAKTNNYVSSYRGVAPTPYVAAPVAHATQEVAPVTAAPVALAPTTTNATLSATLLETSQLNAQLQNAQLQQVQLQSPRTVRGLASP